MTLSRIIPQIMPIKHGLDRLHINDSSMLKTLEVVDNVWFMLVIGSVDILKEQILLFSCVYAIYLVVVLCTQNGLSTVSQLTSREMH